MKNILVGCAGVLSAIILFGMTLISAAIYSLFLYKAVGWDHNLGAFGTALWGIGVIPIIISVVLFIDGGYYMLRGLRES